MRIVDFLKDFFGGKSEVNITDKINYDSTTLAAKAFSIEIAINLIIGLVCKCEFRTFLKWKEVKASEYYLWNIAPNRNQNATEFIDQMLHKLYMENEVLIIQSDDGQLLIADSYGHDEHALFDDKFTGVTVKDYSYRRDFYMSDVIFIKMHDVNITALLNDLTDDYSKIIEMAVNKYKREGGRKGTAKLNMPRQGDEEGNKRIKKLFETNFKEYYEAENAVLPLNNGEEYTEQTGASSSKDNGMQNILTILDSQLDSVARAMKIPPAILKGNISDISQATDNLLTFCIDPLVDNIQKSINKAEYGKEVLNGSFIKIDTTRIKHIDIFSVATSIDKLISDGIYSIDELRTKIGDTVLDSDYSDRHYMTKNYIGIENIDTANKQGGDDNE